MNHKRNLPVSPPNGWRPARLRDVVTFRNGSEYYDVEVDEPGYPVYGSGGRFRWANAWLHDGPSVLFGRKGTIDRPLYVDSKFWTVDTMYYTVPDTRLIHPKFLYYWATRLPFDYYSTGTALPSMTQTDLGSEPIMLPDVKAQRQIADYLDHETAEVDAFIADLRTSAALAIERMRALATSQMDRAAVAAGVTTILGHVISVNEGQVDPADERFTDLPLIAPNHIESRTGRLLHLESAREQAASSGKYQVRPGQVIYSKIRPALMKATIAPSEALCAADMYAMDARLPWLSNAYLLEYLLSDRFEQYAVTMSDRVAMPKLNRDTLAHAPIALPNLTAQERVVSVIKSTRRQQSAAAADIDAAIALAKERRAALITAAVTGQIDVTTRQQPVVDSIQTAIEEAR